MAPTDFARSSSVLFLILLLLVMHDIKPDHRRLTDKPIETREKCRWIAWKKKHECENDISSSPGNGNPNNGGQKTHSDQPPGPQDPISLSRSHMKVFTNQRPKPTGHAWRIAIVYHGHYDRRGSRFSDSPSCSDFFLNAANHQEMIFDPLEKILDASVEVFFHTYTHETCSEKDEALVKHLNPVSYAFSPFHVAKNTRVVDSYVHALDLVLAYSKTEQAPLAPIVPPPKIETVPAGYAIVEEPVSSQVESIDPRLFRETTSTSPGWGVSGWGSTGLMDKDDDSVGSAPVSLQKLPLSMWKKNLGASSGGRGGVGGNGGGGWKHENKKRSRRKRRLDERRLDPSKDETENLVYDAVILCRFDVKYAKPITSLPLEWGGLGVPISNGNINSPQRNKQKLNGGGGRGGDGKLTAMFPVKQPQCLGPHGWVPCVGNDLDDQVKRRELLPFLKFFSSSSQKQHDSKPNDEETLPLENEMMVNSIDKIVRNKENQEEIGVKSLNSKSPFLKIGAQIENTKNIKQLQQQQQHHPSVSALNQQKPKPKSMNRPPSLPNKAPTKHASSSTSSSTNRLLSSSYLAWRDEKRQWNEKKKVSDLFFVIPRNHVMALRQALNFSPGGRTSAHFFMPKFASMVGISNIRFIDDSRYGSSNVQIGLQVPKSPSLVSSSASSSSLLGDEHDMKKKILKFPDHAFIAIERSCTGKVLDAITAKQSQATDSTQLSSPSTHCWRLGS